MLECGFESRLGFEFLGYVNVTFSEAHHQGFSLSTPVSSPSLSVNGSANKIKLK